MFTALNDQFLLRLAINMATLLILVRFCYCRFSPSRDFISSFSLFGLGVFIVSHLLHSVAISMGFAFGLFAIFSMLRYRTETISIRDMTYLFLVITVSLLSAVSLVTAGELILLNILICACTLLYESSFILPKLTVKRIRYEKIENIRPENREQLLQDLSQRTGLKIHDVIIGKVDFLRDTANLKIYFEPEQKSLLDITGTDNNS